MTGIAMKRCAQYHGKLGLGVRSRNVWNGRWWVHVRYCSTHCEALHELERSAMETRLRPTTQTISKTPSTPRLRWPVSEHFRLQSARSRSPRDDCRLCHTVLAATNKCLAQISSGKI